ncbi:hypothetical protein N781_16505 [Pontibacillus halophilus JSM 076056 = DSM 19796]|uniref:RQC domain-containing protein n=2 Tax=Pontibacillus TaxID=289201 RepID=A0A0A5GH04_9BACI|nr:RQC-minor-2 family DNA-binding protein [Pontibacillus halophilus]KGX92491.1 hypothetical protein N781_16505 [Pontibacillus halophilus JSM 076056 = DSM 19796]
MALTQLAYQEDSLPLLVFYPGGKKHKWIRSIDSKVRRGALARVHGLLEEILHTFSDKDIQAVREFLRIEGDGILPILINREGGLYLGGFVKPELFLFREFSPNHGIPIHNEYLFELHLNRLSNERLRSLLEKLLSQYVFTAHLSELEEKEWKERIQSAFYAHPLIAFGREQKVVIESIEKMNRSNLLSQLKYPDDIAYWRQRVEIVMRPFRAIPGQWLWSEGGELCGHEKVMVVDSRTENLILQCEVCRYEVYFNPVDYVLTLPEEFDVERAKKRISTTERQFNEIARNNERLLDKLRELAKLKEKVECLQGEWMRIKETLTSIDQLPRLEGERPHHPVEEMFRLLESSYFPKEQIQPELQSFSNIELQDVRMLNKVEEWLDLLKVGLPQLLRRYQEQLDHYFEQNRASDQLEFMVVNKQPLYWQEVESIFHLIYEEGRNSSAQLLTQVVTGKATNKIRALRLHEARQFGVLQHWLEKDVMKVLKRLEKEGWITKQKKGYTLSARALPYVEG